MTWDIRQGDWIEVLRTMPDESVHCVVTSPPYWRQRDYGIAGQLGLEKRPEEYVEKLVLGLREARRVLRSDGTLWLNLGDKWASGGNGGGGSFMEERGAAWAHAKDAKGWRNPPEGYKDKDLVGIPWMTAFALRGDGWYLRQANVWAKPNGMPESVQDRPTISHEYVFLLSKKNDYYYDIEHARTPAAPNTETRLAQDVESQSGSLRANGGDARPMKAGGRKATQPDNHKHLGNFRDKQRGHSRKHEGFNDRWDAMSKEEQQQSGANLRSVWWVSPAQYGEEHYAVMPDRIAEICIVAGCPEGGTVLDPFSGAGTTGLVATRLGRNYIGIELNPSYIEMANNRIVQDAPLFNQAGQASATSGRDPQQPLPGATEA
jgi:DNA modification methylase